MSDPVRPAEDDDREERSGRFEPVDTHMWELPDNELVTPRKKRDPTARFIVPGLVALLIVIILLVLWLI